MRWKHALLILAVCLVPVVAAAQQAGSASGVVVQKTGSVVVGATVQVSGELMPTARTTVTSDNGIFNFTQLLPGDYTIVVEKSGIGKASQKLVVSVGRDTQVDFLLGGLNEVVTVSAGARSIDLKSSEVGFNYRRDFIQDLPLERSYLGLLQLTPGVADNGGFAPNAGGSRQDNTYLLDSVNITNPLFGYLSTEVNELDIAEVNMKRGGISAEFGRSTGFVSNAVTRSGTNKLAGNYRFEAIPKGWVKESLNGVRSTIDRWVNAFNVGGPIKKNQVFFYASGRLFRSQTTRAANLSGILPNRKESVNEFFGKVTAQIGPTQSLNAGYRHRPTKIDYAGIGANDAPSVGTNVEGTNRVANVDYNWFITSRMTASVKYIYMEEQSETVAITDLGFQPAFNPNNLAAMGRSVQNGIGIGGAALQLNRANYNRHEVKASLNRFMDIGKTQHRMSAGFGYDRGLEDLTRQSNGWGEISSVIVSGQSRIRGTYYPTQPTQFSIGRTYSLFLQDDITLGTRLTVNAGLLFNRDEFAQQIDQLTSTAPNIVTGTFLTFGFGEEVQPRLGFSYQLRKGAGDKAYGTWGRYYGLDQKSSARSLASGRLFTENADFDPVTGALISQAPAANTAAKNIAPGLNPPYTDEALVGYATPLIDGWSFDAFYQYRHSQSFIEDIPTVLPFSTFRYQNDPAAFRKYKTFTFELSRRLRNNWAMTFSYAWSKLYGTYDQDYSGGLAGAPVFNTSSLLNDGPGSFTADSFRNGVMSQDRTHVYKLMATWMPPQIKNFSLGTYIRGQSGTPWEARGLPWGSGATYLRYLEPAGSNRNPFWTNVDLLLKYGMPFGGRKVSLEGRLLNVFNKETVLLVDQRRFLNARNQTTVGTPSADCLSCWTDAYTAAQPTTTPNASFGLPTAYATPRRFLMSLLFDF
jgi:hypothetical protein